MELVVFVRLETQNFPYVFLCEDKFLNLMALN